MLGKEASAGGAVGPSPKCRIREAAGRKQQAARMAPFGRSQKRSRLRIPRPLLGFLHAKNEGVSGDVDENKGEGKAGVRFQVPGIRECVARVLGLHGKIKVQDSRS